MKSTDALGRKGALVWSALRLVLPRKVRWFYEGHPRLRGQMWYAERRLIYQTVRRHKPQHCFEIGTWQGGGSTLFISQALRDNGAGKLHTVEVDRGFYEEAVRKYREYVPALTPHVEFHYGDYREEYGAILEKGGGVDFLLLDGQEDPEETLEQFEFFRPYASGGTILMAHDWYTDKCALLRTALEGSGQWEILTVMGPPRSVGLVVAVRKSP